MAALTLNSVKIYFIGIVIHDSDSMSLGHIHRK